MSAPEVRFDVASAQPRTTAVPWSHLSIELGHLYMEDLARGPDVLREHFARVAPIITDIRRREAERHPGRPRISTCFLIDDYFSDLRPPRELIPEVIEAAAGAGVPLDYVSRESACAHTGGISPAELVLSRLVEEPAAGSDGSRPPTRETGWLSNGQRVVNHDIHEAMKGRLQWEPPRENAARMHSIYMDVELWRDHKDRERLWSCAYLAAVWQLLRLGMLRNKGEPVVSPVRYEGTLPKAWADVPPVLQVPDRAHPFTAFRTCTVLSPRFMTIETAVRLILGQVSLDPEVRELTAEGASRERLDLPDELVMRISHVFSDGA